MVFFCRLLIVTCKQLPVHFHLTEQNNEWMNNRRQEFGDFSNKFHNFFLFVSNIHLFFLFFNFPLFFISQRKYIWVDKTLFVAYAEFTNKIIGSLSIYSVCINLYRCCFFLKNCMFIDLLKRLFDGSKRRSRRLLNFNCFTITIEFWFGCAFSWLNFSCFFFILVLFRNRLKNVIEIRCCCACYLRIFYVFFFLSSI